MPSVDTAEPPEFLRLAAHPLRWRLLTELARSDYRVRELVGLVAQPQNLVSYHLRLLRRGGLITAGRSSFDGRDSYYHLDLDRCGSGLAASAAALHPGLAPPGVEPGGAVGSVLFVCTGNSGRSPIAEALLRYRTGGAAVVASAGSAPRKHMHPDAIRVLDDMFGIDISEQVPRHLDSLDDHRFDRVITLCDKAREVCPEFDHHPLRAHWSIRDPAAMGDNDRDTYAAFENAAAEIDTRIKYLVPVLTGNNTLQRR